MSAHPAASDRRADRETHGVPFVHAVRVWLKVAALSFGGPAGQIAVMHRVVVEEERWVGEQRFLHALNYCMLLPGPEAQQLATYLGWLMHRTRGALVAGVLFVLPGALSIMVLSWVYVLYGSLGIVAGLFYGLKAAVIAVVLQALLRVGAKALGNSARRGVALAAFVALFFFSVPFPLVVLVAGLLGYLAGRAGRMEFAAGGGHGSAASDGLSDGDSVLGEALPAHARPGGARTLRVAAVCLALWLVPIALLWLTLGEAATFTRIATFFSTMAVVTFGGAYAVLAYVAQQAVENYGWLAPGEMLDGLGLAETTPGPLIMVLQFVGFLGAYRDPGGMSPLLAGTLGGLLATWVTFAPCFLWILAGAPFVERLRGHRALAGALAAITAAVVGVIANLALWFALAVLFREARTVAVGPLEFEWPLIASVEWPALVLSAAALLALTRASAPLLAVLAAACVAGAGLHLAGLA